MTEKLYLHRFDRDDMEGMCWTEYVVSSDSFLSSDWRHIPSEKKTVIDWSESSDIMYDYPDAVKVNECEGGCGRKLVGIEYPYVCGPCFTHSSRK